jgi:putative ABC transport system permease protein
MRLNDIFGYSFGAIRLRKLRSALTILGVVVGIAAIVALLSITQGLQVTITDQLNRGLAANTLIVTAGSVGTGRGSTSNGFILYVDDTNQINTLSPDIVSSFAVMQRAGYVEAGGVDTSVTIYGVDFTQYAQRYSTTFVAASGTIPPNPTDNDIVVGTKVNDPSQNGTLLFNAGDNVNIIYTNSSALRLVNETYTGNVAAVLAPIGGFGLGGPSDTGVYIPINETETLFGTTQCNFIIVTLKDSDQTTIDNATSAISSYFGGQADVQSATAVLNTLQETLSTVQTFLASLAAIALLVAGIGIMNIMIVSLIERTREIGVLKALGMKSRTVLSIFLWEAVIIGLIGAVIGIVSGWSVAQVVSRIGFRASTTTAGPLLEALHGGITPVLTPTVVVGAFAFGVCVSVIFALYPAWRASRIKPSEAMRYE